jgi:hypothetical protein
LSHPDLHPDKEFPQRGGITAPAVANPEPGCGNGINGPWYSIGLQEQPLVLDADDDLVMRINDCSGYQGLNSFGMKGTDQKKEANKSRETIQVDKLDL